MSFLRPRVIKQHKTQTQTLHQELNQILHSLRTTKAVSTVLTEFLFSNSWKVLLPEAVFVLPISAPNMTVLIYHQEAEVVKVEWVPCDVPCLLKGWSPGKKRLNLNVVSSTVCASVAECIAHWHDPDFIHSVACTSPACVIVGRHIGLGAAWWPLQEP